MQVDVVVPERRESLDVLVADVALGGTELVESGRHVASVPHRDGVQDQTERPELVILALAVGLAQLPAVTVEDLPGQRVAGLAPDELGEDAR